MSEPKLIEKMCYTHCDSWKPLIVQCITCNVELDVLEEPYFRVGNYCDKCWPKSDFYKNIVISRDRLDKTMAWLHKDKDERSLI